MGDGKLVRDKSTPENRRFWDGVESAAHAPETLDLLCEVVGRLLIEVGQHMNPQIVADLDMTKIQKAAERAVRKQIGGEDG